MKQFQLTTLSLKVHLKSLMAVQISCASWQTVTDFERQLSVMLLQLLPIWPASLLPRRAMSCRKLLHPVERAVSLSSVLIQPRDRSSVDQTLVVSHLLLIVNVSSEVLQQWRTTWSQMSVLWRQHLARHAVVQLLGYDNSNVTTTVQLVQAPLHVCAVFQPREHRSEARFDDEQSSSTNCWKFRFH